MSQRHYPYQHPQPKNTEDQYHHIAREGIEDLNDYRPGGYHPLQLNNLLHANRYQVVDKLGSGVHSTSWLARDVEKERYVAIKVVTAETSEASHEASILSLLRSGKEIIQPLLDKFWISGPNGKRRCIVTPPAKVSLAISKEDWVYGLFQPQVARSIAAQLIRGIAFLHGEGIVHGDLYLGNVLLQFPSSIHHLSTADLHSRFDAPKYEPIMRIDKKPLAHGVPAHAVVPAWFGSSSKEILPGQERIFLGDFGESFNPHVSRRFRTRANILHRSPETTFSGEPLSFPSDIWALGCTVWEILGNDPIFGTLFAKPDLVTAEQVEALGVLPAEWWGKWSKGREWFTDEGDLTHEALSLRRDGYKGRDFDQRFEDDIQGPWREVATAEEVLGSEWMAGWGLPAVEQDLGNK
ncbi:kinase-like domain-containing protein [Aspergillus aurantiobrunneus]